MNFNITEQASSIHSAFGQRIRIPPKAADSIGHADAIIIKALHVLWIEFAGQNLASEAGALISDSFFIRTADNFDRERKVGFRITEMLDASNGDEDTEWAVDRAAGAQHIGRGVLERDVETLIPDKAAPIVLYCGGGFRSALAADNLQRMGYTHVVSMDGGIRAWREAGYPIEHG